MVCHQVLMSFYEGETKGQNVEYRENILDISTEEFMRYITSILTLKEVGNIDFLTQDTTAIIMHC